MHPFFQFFFCNSRKGGKERRETNQIEKERKNEDQGRKHPKRSEGKRRKEKGRLEEKIRRREGLES